MNFQQAKENQHKTVFSLAYKKIQNEIKYWIHFQKFHIQFSHQKLIHDMPPGEAFFFDYLPYEQLKELKKKLEYFQRISKQKKYNILPDYEFYQLWSFLHIFHSETKQFFANEMQHLEGHSKFIIFQNLIKINVQKKKPLSIKNDLLPQIQSNPSNNNLLETEKDTFSVNSLMSIENEEEIFLEDKSHENTTQFMHTPTPSIITTPRSTSRLELFQQKANNPVLQEMQTSENAAQESLKVHHSKEIINISSSQSQDEQGISTINNFLALRSIIKPIPQYQNVDENLTEKFDESTLEANTVSDKQICLDADACSKHAAEIINLPEVSITTLMIGDINELNKNWDLTSIEKGCIEVEKPADNGNNHGPEEEEEKKKKASKKKITSSPSKNILVSISNEPNESIKYLNKRQSHEQKKKSNPKKTNQK